MISVLYGVIPWSSGTNTPRLRTALYILYIISSLGRGGCSTENFRSLLSVHDHYIVAARYERRAYCDDLAENLGRRGQTNRCVVLMDRRQHERYNLKAPVKFSWIDQNGVRQRCRGVLNNISGGGVLVSTHESPPNGALIHFSVFFSSLYGGARLVIRAVGQVLRVKLASQGGKISEFAATIKTFTLHDDQKLIGDGVIGERLNSRVRGEKRG